MIVKALSIQNWKQFETIELHFHEKMNVIVGENGSGKTTILHIINILLEDGLKGRKEDAKTKNKIGSLTLQGNKITSIYELNIGTDSYPGVSSHVPKEGKLQKSIYIPVHKCQLSYIKKDIEVLINDLDKREAFNKTLKEILPESLGLNSISIQGSTIGISTKSGVKELECLSSGLTYLFCLTWYIFQMNYLNQTPSLILIDELEAHLHPSLQRSILPKLMSTFPLSQFIISTHSPHIIHSVKDSLIYTLTFNEEYRVISTKMDYFKNGPSITAILRDILGVPGMYPIWLIDELTNIKSRYLGKELTVETYRSLKDDMQKAGLFPIFPQMVRELQESDGNDLSKKN